MTKGNFYIFMEKEIRICVVDPLLLNIISNEMEI